SIDARIAARLVRPLGAAEAPSVPCRDGLAFEFGEPEAEPTALERVGREASMELGRCAAQHTDGNRSPTSVVQAHERIHVWREPAGIVREPERETVLAYELALATADVLAKLPVLRREIVLPADAVEAKDDVVLPCHQRPSDQPLPALLVREAFGEDEAAT